jgi:branched-chain amino acid transport system ATP-binding protein
LAAILEVDDLSVSYGGVVAVSGVSFSVATGHCLAILGPNGAGKTSLLRAISGLVPKQSGTVRKSGRDISSIAPQQLARMGLAHVPEGRRVIAPLTVEENLVLSAKASHRLSRSELPEQLQRMYSLFPRLGERRRQASGLLSGGEQQMLALARALITHPDVIMMDEPSMGLAPIMVDRIYELFDSAASVLREVAVVLVEQSASHALHVADHVCLLAGGKLGFSGPASQIDADLVLREAYLGRRTD